MRFCGPFNLAGGAFAEAVISWNPFETPTVTIGSGNVNNGQGTVTGRQAVMILTITGTGSLTVGNGSRPRCSAPPKHRRKFAVSGEESILAFVKRKSNPVGKDIQKHWASEGRAGAAANLISKLVKAKRLKRTPLSGERGSRYSLA